MSDSRVTQVLCSDLDSCNVVQGNTVRKILVPFDNSSHSARSFGTALDMAKNRGASIVVISVIQE
ncbi:MAG: universal stress protein, partial [Nitrosopumilaceae archaeon]|nr:universal stress protein [Nitrosopumilaceae archaeon]